MWLNTCQDNPGGTLPGRPEWLCALGGGLLRNPLPRTCDESMADQYWWQEAAPWQQIQKLSPLLAYMTPCDVSAFVIAAEQTGFNSLALLIMGVAKHPVFVTIVSQLIGNNHLVDATGIAWAIRTALKGLANDSDAVRQYPMKSLTDTLECLGILKRDSAKTGMLIGDAFYKVVRGVPSPLQSIVDDERSHYFPRVTNASHIPGYLESWCKFLTRMPAGLEVGDGDDMNGVRAFTDKLLVWLRSRFPDASPTTVEDAAFWWPCGSRLNTSLIHVLNAALPTKCVCSQHAAQVVLPGGHQHLFNFPAELTDHQVCAILGVPLELTQMWKSLVEVSLSTNVIAYLADPKRFRMEDTPPRRNHHPTSSNVCWCACHVTYVTVNSLQDLRRELKRHCKTAGYPPTPLILFKQLLYPSSGET